MRETGCWEKCQLRGRVPGPERRKGPSARRSPASGDTL